MCQGARNYTKCHTHNPHLSYLNPHKYPRDRYLYFPKDADEEIGIKKFSNETNAMRLVSANARMEPV